MVIAPLFLINLFPIFQDFPKNGIILNIANSVPAFLLIRLWSPQKSLMTGLKVIIRIYPKMVQ